VQRAAEVIRGPRIGRCSCSPRQHSYSRECASSRDSSRRSAPDPPHHCPL